MENKETTKLKRETANYFILEGGRKRNWVQRKAKERFLYRAHLKEKTMIVRRSDAQLA